MDENYLGDLIEETKSLNSTLTRLLRLLRSCEKFSRAPVKNISRLEAVIPQISKLLRPEIPEPIRLRIEEWVRAMNTDLKRLKEEARLEFGRELARLLENDGLELKGQAPNFYLNFFTINVNFTSGHCAIYFGPELIKANIRLAPSEVARVLKNLYLKLSSSPFDGEKFLKELHQAYVRALKLRDKPEGEPIPIVWVLSELSFLLQSSKFTRDPRKENFRSYGRVQFGYDLYRLRKSQVRSMSGIEWRLGVATFDRTGKKEEFVWVPNDESSTDGTRYAWISFLPQDSSKL